MLNDISQRLHVSLGFDLMDVWLLFALAAVVVCRLTWLIAYFRKMGKRSFKALHVEVFPRAGETAEQKARRNEDFFAVTVRQESTLLVVGSIVLATWAVLFTTLKSAPSSDVSSLSRNLLLASSVTFMIARTFFRSAGREMSFIGTEGATAIGYSAFALALASILADLFNIGGAILALIIATCLVVRELMEVRELVRSYQ
ncbi:hypothetical protein [Streptomyces sp. NPDC058335]|uniref:hypothetical protein n=1 Tax=Streptomyces sp. NPDC058335 TaxID=3346451 RepID=UPI0036513934